MTKNVLKNILKDKRFMLSLSVMIMILLTMILLIIIEFIRVIE